jgi:flagellar motor switch protein FliM
MAETRAAQEAAPAAGAPNDALASEWAAMAGDGAAGAPDTAGRVLEKGEIDSLLAGGGGQGQGGITAILNSTQVSYERLPMLEVVFDRLVRMLSTSLRNFTSETVEVMLDGMTSTRFGSYMGALAQPTMIAVFKVEEWENFGIVTVDSALTYTIVDVLLGGRRGAAASQRGDARRFTTIERNLVERLVRIVVTDMALAFEPLQKVRFTLDRLEVNPRFATIVRPANAVIVVRLSLDIGDRGGLIEIVLPYATLEPIRENLLQMFAGEKFGRDSIWEAHLATAIWNSEIGIDAVLDQLVLPLREVANLKVGKTVMLNCPVDAPVVLRCGGLNMATGELGRLGNNIAVRVDGSLKSKEAAR